MRRIPSLQQSLKPVYTDLVRRVPTGANAKGKTTYGWERGNGTPLSPADHQRLVDLKLRPDPSPDIISVGEKPDSSAKTAFPQGFRFCYLA